MKDESFEISDDDLITSELELSLKVKKICFICVVLLPLSVFSQSFIEETSSLCKRISKNEALSRRAHRLTSRPFYGCSHRVPWIKNLKSIVCNKDIQTEASIVNKLDSMKFPNKIIFFFAGASDFNSKRVKAMIDPVNLTGWEGRDLIGANVTGKMFKKVFYRKGSPLKREDFLIQYYAGSEFKRRHSRKTGRACARQTFEYFNFIKRYNKTGDIPAKVIVAGYSNGGAMAIDTQIYLGNLGHSVDLVLSLDPIVKASRFIFTSKKGHYRKKHKNTKRLVNFYQRRDLGSLMGIPLRGHPVRDADENIRVNCKTSKGMRCNGWWNHIQITRSSAVVDTIIDELATL